MQLKLRRGQRSAMIGSKTVFTLDLIVELDLEERALVEKYQLQHQTVYSTEASTANATRAQAGDVKALGALVADKLLKRFFTVKNLIAGERIECKDLGELLAVEDQVREACTNLKRYLGVATCFDGREEIVDIAA